MNSTKPDELNKNKKSFLAIPSCRHRYSPPPTAIQKSIPDNLTSLHPINKPNGILNDTPTPILMMLGINLFYLLVSLIYRI